MLPLLRAVPLPSVARVGVASTSYCALHTSSRAAAGDGSDADGGPPPLSSTKAAERALDADAPAAGQAAGRVPRAPRGGVSASNERMISAAYRAQPRPASRASLAIPHNLPRRRRGVGLADRLSSPRIRRPASNPIQHG